MANPTFSKASLGQDFLKGQEINRLQRMRFDIWFMVKELAQIGGTNYESTLGTTLVSDANTVLEGFDRDQVDAGFASVDYNNAVASGASVSSDPSALALSTRVLKDIPEDKLVKIKLMLKCKLGVHKAYVQ